VQKLFVSVVLIVYSLVFASSSSAATIGFSPVAQSASLGDPVSVDVVVSGLGGEIVSAYDLDVTYDATVLDATSVTFSPFLGDPSFFEVFEGFNLGTVGVVDLAALSLLSDASLLSLQGGSSVVLATLEFMTVGFGTSLLDFSWDAWNDVTGAGGAPLDVESDSGSIDVPTPVPVPAAIWLFGTALLGFIGFSRRTVVS